MATPYELLLGMSLLREKKRIRERKENTESEGNSFLQVTVSHQDILVRQTDIEEIIPATSITQIPDTQSWFKGLSSYRGNLLPLINLSVLLIGDNPTNHPNNNEVRILVIQATEGFLGLYVQKVEGIQHHWLHKNNTQNAKNSRISHYCRHYQKQNGTTVSVLDIDEIKQSRDFLNV